MSGLVQTGNGNQTEHTEWQWPISANIPSKKQPWLVRVGGALPPSFTLFTITYKVSVYAPAERADTLPPISSLPCMYSVGKTPLRYRTTSPCGQGGRKSDEIHQCNKKRLTTPPVSPI